MLDILLKGRRLHLGIGRGISPHEYASLGYPMEESHKYFYDVINAIRVADGIRAPVVCPGPGRRALIAGSPLQSQSNRLKGLLFVLRQYGLRLS